VGSVDDQVEEDLVELPDVAGHVGQFSEVELNVRDILVLMAADDQCGTGRLVEVRWRLL
jgi:hypothetical protein